jgi:hypothetical protein
MSATEETAASIAASDKAKASRARYAGWLSRAINQYESSGDIPSVLTAIRDRITSQLSRLQTSHNLYMSTLTDDDQMEEADTWMEEYFEKATKALTEIESRVKDARKAIVDAEAEQGTTDSSKRLPQPLTSQHPSKVSSQSPSLDSLPENPTQSPPNDSGSTQAFSPSPAALTDSLSQPNAMSANTAASLDSWIDDLVVGVETAESSSRISRDLGEALAKLEMERDLPRIELPTFDGSPLTWPRFIEQFYVQVHSRIGLNDSRRMDLLQSHVRGEAKRLIEGLGYSAKNYALSLKELKFAFGQRIIVARAYIDAVTSGNILPTADPIALRNFYISVRDCITTLQQMSYTSEIHSGDALQRAIRRIPSDKRVKWNDFVRNICRSREPNLIDLERWLKECIESEFNPYAIAARSQREIPSNARPSSSRTSNVNTVKSAVGSSEFKPCPLCSATHHITKCKDYLSKSAEGRYELIKSMSLCFNCLSHNHRIADCKSTGTCKVTGCSARHHTSLHRTRPGPANNVQGRVNNLNSRVVKVYFQVLPVIVQGNNGRRVKTFALLDSASDITMITSDLADDLGLRGQSEALTLNTVSSAVTIASKRVSLTVRAQNDPDAQVLRIKEAWTKTGVFKCSSIKASDLKGFPQSQEITIADVEPNQVKLLIGANIPRAHIQIDSRIGVPDGPVAIRTLLGWCIMGPSFGPSTDSVSANVNFLSSEEDSLSIQVEKFWKTESFGVSANFSKPTSIEDQRSLHALKAGTKLIDGHFQVPMLWKEKMEPLPNNRPQADQRFNSLLRRLSSDQDLQDKYAAEMNGYVSKGYARKLTCEEAVACSKTTWYLPHHCVVNPNKPGKVRVVFDAAASYKGTSLNSQLMTGPDMTNSLFAVIQRFRMQPVALVADIKEMFHQVKVQEPDSDALRFLWKEDLNEPGPPQVFKMLVHIFGAKDSPSCVNFALRQAAFGADEDVTETILQNFYVDDMLKASPDVPSAISLAHRLTDVLAIHGFQLTKWMSPSAEVLSSLPEASANAEYFDMDLENLPVQKALGLCWTVYKDCFVFNPLVKDFAMTKRTFISAISSVYDPCGFLTPFIFRAKCLVQELWRAKLDWDDVVPEDLKEQCCNWYAELPLLKNLLIPRYHGCMGKQLELHIFCDASEAGFAAVAYLRMVDAASIQCSFLASRSHVAPLKPILTIPKLELQGAVMAVRLAKTLQEDIGVKSVMFWTDAITVLRYISNEERRWKIFVANRVAEIREHTVPSQWKYLPSSQNPADDASRGLDAESLVLESRWFQGPMFLWYGEDGWPPQPEITAPTSDVELRRPSGIVTTVSSSSCSEFDLGTVINPQDYSSWSGLARHTAWVFRALKIFLSSVRASDVPVVKEKRLAPSELCEAEIALARFAQMEGFPEEYKCLYQHDNIVVE